MSNDLNTVTIPTKETLNPLQSESGGVDEYRSQTKFKKYVSNFRENNSDRSINVGKSELAVSSEKFFANLELPVCAPLSSSVPTSSYGDQVSWRRRGFLT